MGPSLPSCLKLEAACATQAKPTRFSKAEESRAARYDGSPLRRQRRSLGKRNTLRHRPGGSDYHLRRHSRLRARYLDGGDVGDRGWNRNGSREESSGYFYRQTRNNNANGSEGGVPSISDSISGSGQSSPSEGGLQKQKRNGNAWKTQIFIVGVCMLLCNLDRVAMGILAVPLLTEFNINLAEMGVLQSSYLWGYLVGQLPAGVAADKFGGTRVMLCGLVLWSLATCGTFLAKLSTFPLTVAITSRVLMGLGSAVALPAVAATVARNVPADQKARSTTMCYALFNVGNVLGNLCTPYVSEYVGWHWSFMIYGALGLVWACISIRIMGAPGKKGEEPLFVQEEKAEKKKLPKIDFRKVVFRKKFLAQLFILMYCHSTIGLGYFTLQSWIPTFMSNDLGITNLKVAGLCTGLVWLATSFNTAFVGVIADKLLSKMPAWKVRKAAMTVSTVVPSICFFILSTTRNPLVGVCCILVGLVCWSFDYAGFHPYVVEVSGNYSGTVLSMTNSAGVIAGIVGNITTGYLVGLEGNFNCVFRILSGVYLVSCILWNLFMKGEKLDFRAA